MSEADAEIALLDKVLSRLAVASESELSSLLDKFLGAILDKLESSHDKTRNKVRIIGVTGVEGEIER